MLAWLIMLPLFYLVVVPIGLVLRLLGRDRLLLRGRRPSYRTASRAAKREDMTKPY